MSYASWLAMLLAERDERDATESEFVAVTFLVSQAVFLAGCRWLAVSSLNRRRPNMLHGLGPLLRCPGTWALVIVSVAF